MTRIYSEMINGVNYEVFGQSWQTHQSWGHNAYILKNGEEIGRNRVRYYNRTWESYQYQTAGEGAVSNAKEELQREIFDTYRWRTGKTRIAAETKAELLAKSPEYQALCQVYEGLQTQRRYN